MIKIATWNVCLGLKNKKDYIYDVITQKEINICLLQEAEIEANYDTNLLTHKDYRIEVEKNKKKARVATIIKNNIEYVRRTDLEIEDFGIIIIDIKIPYTCRIVNVYRSFNPQNGLTPLNFFETQLQIIKAASEDLKGIQLIITGDFNLDDQKRYATDYRGKQFFQKLNPLMDEIPLIQIINEPTWQRVVNNTLRESTIDHLYVKNPLVIHNIEYLKPLIGDHKLITFEINAIAKPQQTIFKRNWSKYSKDKLLAALAAEPFCIETPNVQDTWNLFENIVITLTDNLAPFEQVTINTNSKPITTPRVIKRKINLRKKLLNKLKTNPSNVLRDRIANLNIEIKLHFANLKTKSIRNKIIPGNSKTLWDAVRTAKNINTPKIPPNMTINNLPIESKDLPEVFADFFLNKVNSIVNQQHISDTVHNGHRKIWTVDHHFMSIDKIVEAVKSLKNKKCEGHDRIPQKILVDGIEILKFPLSYLFDQIYTTKKIPNQWLIAKVTPIHKKSNVNSVENYRPISNLCSTSKIFEKLILKRLGRLEFLKNVDLTGKSQHGFKTKHSTATAGLKIQSVIARALNEGEYALMSTLDLSSAFDVVNVELLIKRLRIVGIPDDIISLVSEWLTTRYFYVSLDGENSYVHQSVVGTVQGSILGPILYAIFVSPLFDLAKMTLFADDNYVIHRSRQISELVTEMKRTLEKIIRWLTNSGLKVNDEKTEICLFYHKDTQPVTIIINGNEIVSKNSMNVLGVHFDSKLNWQTHAQIAISKARKALQAIKIIRKHFTKNELYSLTVSNYYSILFYNSEIWLLPSLTANTNKIVLSASALKLCYPAYNNMISYDQLHSTLKRATPQAIIKYNHAILLYKTYNSEHQDTDWLDINFNQNFNERANKVIFYDTSKNKQGKNILCNRLTIINNTIPYEWLNLPYKAYKTKSKLPFLV